MTADCASCMDTGWVTRASACPCRAPEKATPSEKRERYDRAIHDPGCQDGWVYIRTTCDCADGEQNRRR
jgi:hypothetical protein